MHGCALSCLSIPVCMCVFFCCCVASVPSERVLDHTSCCFVHISPPALMQTSHCGCNVRHRQALVPLLPIFLLLCGGWWLICIVVVVLCENTSSVYMCMCVCVLHMSGEMICAWVHKHKRAFTVPSKKVSSPLLWSIFACIHLACVVRVYKNRL